MSAKASTDPEKKETTNEEEDGEFVIPHSTSTFKQQKLAACKPFLSPIFAALIYGIFAIVSLIIGLIYYFASEDMHEIVFDYTNVASGEPQTINFPIALNGDIYVYYELTNYYQNNYVYSDSKSWDQWLGADFQSADIDKCSPVKTGEGDRPYAPCGAVSLSVFNDTFTMSSNFPAILENDITPKCYRDLIKPLPSSWNSTNSIFTLNPTLFPENQGSDHFISWALIAPFPTFRKVWGILN